MKKFILMMIVCMGIISATTFAEAADQWIYTDRNGYEYYLREAARDGRTWASAKVVKIKGNNVTDLLYIFEVWNQVPYKVYHYQDGYSHDYRNGKFGSPIEFSDNVYSNVVASKIWDEYIPHPQLRN